eukprot:TRINITY_DN571_c1_g1_i1.p2 TRINITY_DN571_c1_g1~~TRINITY_DN571_c1_g1_i1.p2  ORF type:complete len:162 (-),score=35.89 TRINITY_DN571_c1_g1_i1:124-609(-)
MIYQPAMRSKTYALEPDFTFKKEILHHLPKPEDSFKPESSFLPRDYFFDDKTAKTPHIGGDAPSEDKHLEEETKEESKEKQPTEQLKQSSIVIPPKNSNTLLFDIDSIDTYKSKKNPEGYQMYMEMLQGIDYSKVPLDNSPKPNPTEHTARTIYYTASKTS